MKSTLKKLAYYGAVFYISYALIVILLELLQLLAGLAFSMIMFFLFVYLIVKIAEGASHTAEDQVKNMNPYSLKDADADKIDMDGTYEKLKQKYIEGRISEQEFEDRVEMYVEAEEQR